MVRGTVQTWHGDLGWGILTTPGVDGDVWAHFSAIEGTGFKSLEPGDEVEFEYVRAHQEGYRYMAVLVRLVRHSDEHSNPAG
jgi:CspA family cold shock protein